MGSFLYILRSIPSDKFYIGSSDDPRRRLEYHNTVEKGFTARYRPWEIAFQQVFPTKEAARIAERTVKSWKSRKMILKLIEGEFKVIPR